MKISAQSVAATLVAEYPTQALEIALELTRLVAVELAQKSAREASAKTRKRDKIRLVDPNPGPIERPPRRETHKEITAAVAVYFGFTMAELYGPSRVLRLAHARFYAWRLMRARLEMSYEQIGIIFKRDHTTILAGMGADDDTQRTLAAILDAAGNPK